MFIERQRGHHSRISCCDDALVWNAHRIYGPIRLRWMMQGFRLLGIFWHRSEGSLFTEHFPVEKFNLNDQFGFDQPAIVLQKVEAAN
ncbi:unnamed protein product, partial [Mesorhabditis belari]|uniref:Uncharacterized protein n=1 Tax=Mesorhabditis belari TaxID=2138241 RepID=A0AAF3J9L5_9BILA